MTWLPVVPIVVSEYRAIFRDAHIVEAYISKDNQFVLYAIWLQTLRQAKATLLSLRKATKPIHDKTIQPRGMFQLIKKL